MDSRIAELSLAIFQAASQEERAAAEMELDELAKTPDFYQICFNLMVSHPNDSVRQEAMIFVRTYMIKYKEIIPPELKQFCFNTFIQIIPNLHLKHLSYAEKIANDWVKLFFFDNMIWTDLLDKIVQLSTDPNLLLPAAMLAKAFCREIKRKPVNAIEVYQHFTLNIFPQLFPILETQNLNTTQMLFHCASRLLMTSEASEPKKKIQMFILPIAEQLYPMLQHLYNYSSILLKIQPTAEYEKLVNQILKFLSSFVYVTKDNLDEQILSQILSYLQSVFVTKPSTKTIGKALELLYSITFRAKIASVLADNAMYFVSEVFASFFILQQNEIEQAEEDPAQFVQNIEKEGQNWNDPRASVAYIIEKAILLKMGPIHEALYAILGNVISNPESSAQLFAVCDLFSTVVFKNDSPELEELMPTLLDLADNDDFLIRAGAFKILSRAADCQSTISALDTCLNHISDDSLLVRYYACVALALIFHTLHKSESREELVSQLREHIGQIVEIFLSIGAEFHSDAISKSLMDILEFFSTDVIPYAVSISQTLFASYIEEVQQAEQSGISGSSLIPAAINTLIECMKGNPNNTEMLNEIYGYNLEAINSLIGHVDLEENFRIASRIVDAASVFVPDYWRILECVSNDLQADPNLMPDQVRPLLSYLIDRDTDINSRGVVPMIVEILKGFVERAEDGMGDILNIAAGLILRTGDVDNIVSAFMENILSEFNENGMQYDCGIDSIASVIIFIRGIHGMDIFGEHSQPILEAWFDCEEFPFKLAAVVNKMNEFMQFDANFATRVLASTVKIVYEQINYDEGDDDDDVVFGGEEEGENENEENKLDQLDSEFCIEKIGAGMYGSSDKMTAWFNQADLIRNFHALLQNISNTGILDSVAQIYEQNEDTNYLSCIDQMIEYANKISKSK